MQAASLAETSLLVMLCIVPLMKLAHIPCISLAWVLKYLATRETRGRATSYCFSVDGNEVPTSSFHAEGLAS